MTWTRACKWVHGSTGRQLENVDLEAGRVGHCAMRSTYHIIKVVQRRLGLLGVAVDAVLARTVRLGFETGLAVIVGLVAGIDGFDVALAEISQTYRFLPSHMQCAGRRPDQKSCDIPGWRSAHLQ